jgi:ligand-binding sensor domain-containing protein/two-component sensor histidine kinase
MSIKITILFLLLFQVNCFAHQQNNFPILNFKPLTINNHLPYPSVFSIAQDDDGLIWAGTTDGLSRNDGYRLKNFFRNPANKEGLSDNTVTGLINFNNKIYTSSNEGTSYYDIKQKKIYQLDTALKTTINKDFRVCFLKQNKQLIAFSSKEYYIIDEQNKVASFTYTFSQTINKQAIIQKLPMLDAIDDNNGHIWICNISMLFKLNANTLVVEEIINRDQLKVNEIASLQIIGNDILVASYAAGIIRYNPLRKEVIPFKTKSPYFKKIVKFTDANNISWFIAAGYRCYCLINPTTFEITNYDFDAEIHNIYVDKKNTIWLATSVGLYYNEQQKKLITIESIEPNFSSITDFATIKNESVDFFLSTKKHYYQILNSGNGAAQFDKNWKFIKSYTNNYKDTNTIAMGSINCIYETDDHYWVTTWYKGLAKCTKDFKVIKWYPKNTPENTVYFSDAKGIEPIGNDKFFIRGFGTLSIFDAKQEKFLQTFYNSKAHPNVLPPGLISSAVMVGNDCYFGTERGGLFKLNILTGKIESILLQFNNLQITKIIQQDSLLWIGTNNGLVKYNIATKVSNTFLRAQGMCNEKVFRMELSKKTNILWMCTYGGVATINTKTNAIKNFYNKDGLYDDADLKNVFVDDMGNILVSNNKFNAFINPSNIEQNTILKKSVITELMLNNENKEWLFSGNEKYINTANNKNNIALHFTFENASDNDNYFYKLNDNWYTSPTGLIQFNNLAPGKYKIYVANQPNDAATNDFITITIRPPFYNTWWFYTLYVIFIGGILYTFFKVRTNNIRKETILQKTYEQKIAESEMQTLRSQMNPHFMFNTLNSINSYIIQNKTALASEYLTTFSKLMRSILDLSKQETVPLEKELNALKMYIELEALRLENKFDYSIVVDKNIDEQTLQIPSLMLQPFVENAIWHGLHNKKDQGTISIKINEIGTKQIMVTIEDDGIGRAAAAALKQAQISHKSYGIDITKNRLQLLNKNNTVTFTDLFDNNNKASGTKVTILINIINNSFA